MANLRSTFHITYMTSRLCQLCFRYRHWRHPGPCPIESSPVDMAPPGEEDEPDFAQPTEPPSSPEMDHPPSVPCQYTDVGVNGAAVGDFFVDGTGEAEEGDNEDAKEEKKLSVALLEKEVLEDLVAAFCIEMVDLKVQKNIDMSAMDAMFKIQAANFVKLTARLLVGKLGADSDAIPDVVEELRAVMPTTWKQAVKWASPILDKCKYVHMCVKDHFIYYKEFESADVTVCGFPGCTEPRFKPGTKKPRAQYRMWDLEERIKRMWANPVLARHAKYAHHRKEVFV